MSSESKKRKVDKRLHWGRGRNFLKDKTKLKGVCFYNSSLRKLINKIDCEEF